MLSVDLTIIMNIFLLYTRTSATLLVLKLLIFYAYSPFEREQYQIIWQIGESRDTSIIFFLINFYI
jgi:hypothetical protein